METKDLTAVQNFAYSEQKIFDKAQDFLPIMGTDYVELYVGNAIFNRVGRYGKSWFYIQCIYFGYRAVPYFTINTFALYPVHQCG